MVSNQPLRNEKKARAGGKKVRNQSRCCRSGSKVCIVDVPQSPKERKEMEGLASMQRWLLGDGEVEQRKKKATNSRTLDRVCHKSTRASAARWKTGTSR